MTLGVNQSHSPITPLLVNPATSFADQFRADCVDSPAEVDPGLGALLPWPLAECSRCHLPRELAKAQSEKAYWRELHQRAKEREARLQDNIAQLQAKLRLREQQLFGRKSEKGQNLPDGAIPKPAATTSPKPRGQQPGSPGHGRRNYDHLPAQVEVCDLPEPERCCPRCGQPYAYSGSEDSATVGIEVRAYRRVYQRRRYRRTCTCEALPLTVIAPPPPKLIPKSILGISVWVTILIDKFQFMRPTYRLLADLKTRGLDLAQGTVTAGLQALMPLFLPLYEALIEQNLRENRWQADETRWLVFATLEGKIGYRWYLWVFRSPSTVVYKLDPWRSAQVPLAHFPPDAAGVLLVDRYSAYKAMAKDRDITLAFCWSHVRRDFLNLGNNWPQQQDWALSWVQDIGQLYHLNRLRLAVLGQPQAFAPRHRDLRRALEQMDQRRDAELHEPDIHPVRRKVLESLQRHWSGLTVFLDHPEVPMDNNESERLERNPVIGRKNFYGSGALWSGQLTAMLFSIFQTHNLWKLNSRLWLQAYLEACAAHGGQAPPDLAPFLPWRMSASQRQAFSLTPQPQDSS
jgi:transposase